MKKLLSVFLVLITVLFSFPAAAFADSADEEAPIIWLNTLEIHITNEKELAESGDVVSISIAATDNVEVSSLVMLIESPSGAVREKVYLTKVSNEYFAAGILIDDETEAGYWNISQMKATDPSGHYMYITNLSEYKFGVKGSILESDIAFKNGSEYKYSPTGVKPKMVVNHGGALLKEGIDYKVEYKNNTSVGTATATVKGIGCFSGTHEKEFAIVPQNQFKVKLSQNTFVYGEKINIPGVTVYDGKYVVPQSEYIYSYPKSLLVVGKYPIKVVMNDLNYTGSKTVYFIVKPRGTTITALSAKKRGFTVKWKKQPTQTTGYQVQYSTDKSFKSGVKSFVTKNKKLTSKTFSKLKSGKKYYVRIRTFTKLSDRTIYSKWSKTKSVKVK